MRQQQDEAYVLGTHELGEADLIVTLLAREHGKVRGVARAARSSRRRFGGALEPLTRVRATWAEREGRELHRVERLETLRSFATMQSEPVCQAAAAVLAEVTEAFSHEGQAEPEAFRLLGATLEALERGLNPWLALRYFEFWTLRLNGLLPDSSACAVCSAPAERRDDLRVSRRGPTCKDCMTALGGPSQRLTREDRGFLEQARRVGPAELGGDAAPARARGALERLLRGTLENYCERRFRTYRHLEAVAAVGSEPGGET